MKCCWGPAKGQHVKACRLGRPLCRWRRKLSLKYQACTCGAYHFPHRYRSGACGDPSRLWAELEQPLRGGAAVYTNG